MKLETRHHLVIPDTQVKKGVPLDHLSWIAQYRIDQFQGENLTTIHLGDGADMPSLSSYDKGKMAMENRRYREDIEASHKADEIFAKPLKDYNANRRANHRTLWHPEDYRLYGNHEDRITRAIESNAQLSGTISLDDLEYEKYGWKTVPFLEVLWLDGVAYSHYFYQPLTGNPYTGTIDNRLKNIGHSFTMGHQQTLMYGIRFVAGKSQHGLVAGACYLHDEDYKGPQGNAHWRGIIVCHDVHDGSYDPMFVSLDYLCRKYEGVPLEKFMSKKYPKLTR